MAKAREEAIVELSVKEVGTDEATSNAIKYAEALDTIEKTARSLSSIVTSVKDGIVNTGKAIAGATGLFRLFNKATVGATGAMGVLRKGTTAWTRQVDKITLPIISRLTAILPILGAALAAVVIATKSWSAAVAENTSIAENNEKITGAMARAWRAVGMTLEPLVGVWSDLTTAIKEHYLLSILGQGVGGAILAMSELEIRYRKELVTLRRAENTELAEYRQILDDISIRSKDSTLTDKEKIDLIREKAAAQEVYNNRLIETIDKELSYLQLQNTGLTPNDEQKIKNLDSIAKLEGRRVSLVNATSNAYAEADITISNMLERAKEKTDDATESLREYNSAWHDWNIFLIEIDKALDSSLSKSLDKMNTFGKTFSDIIYDNIDEFAAAEEKITDIMDADAERSARNRIAWAEFGAEGQLSVIASLFGSASQLAGDNLDNQKGYAISEAIVNTALALTKVWAKPGYPVAIPLSAAIAANGIAQIANIKNADNESGSVLNPMVTTSRSPIETASSSFIRDNATTSPEPQIVLVTEDLNAVNTRVSIVESRASLG